MMMFDCAQAVVRLAHFSQRRGHGLRLRVERPDVEIRAWTAVLVEDLAQTVPLDLVSLQR